MFPGLIWMEGEKMEALAGLHFFITFFHHLFSSTTFRARSSLAWEKVS